jgi:galactokinase
MANESAAVAAFRAQFGTRPTLRIEAPGRVNLIGEHIDYNGLAVLPMAIPRRVTLFVRARDDALIRICSADARYGLREFELASRIEPFPPGDWGNYAKAAAQELMRDTFDACGMDAWLESDLLPAAGLSSSSALVVAVALALLHVNDRVMPQLELAERMADAEQYVGTRGGGMDQAICLAGRAGYACRIEFRPLRVHHIPVPPGWHVIVAYSGVRAEKSALAREVYNARAQQCAQALTVVAATMGEPAASYSVLTTRWAVDELLQSGESSLPGELFWRFRHVVTEADRVRQAERALNEGDLLAFGALMDASHASLRDAFEVSTPVLDAMVATARTAGAAGARLTGAGFGGSIVVLSDEAKSPAIVRALERDRNRLGKSAGADALFVARPVEGATVHTLPE